MISCHGDADRVRQPPFFSWMLFRKVSNPADMKEGTVELGKAGIEITSPVLGVIIPALAFFYLYLIHVYPVSDIF